MQSSKSVWEKLGIVVAIIAVIALSWAVVNWQNLKPSLTCAKEGERIGAEDMPTRCCSGLKPVGSKPFSEAPSGLSICSR